MWSSQYSALDAWSFAWIRAPITRMQWTVSEAHELGIDHDPQLHVSKSIDVGSRSESHWLVRRTS